MKGSKRAQPGASTQLPEIERRAAPLPGKMARATRQPMSFVGGSRHFVERYFVVSASSLAGTSGDSMTSRSMLLSSAALLFPISALPAQSTAPAPTAAPEAAAPAPAAAPSD